MPESPALTEGSPLGLVQGGEWSERELDARSGRSGERRSDHAEEGDIRRGTGTVEALAQAAPGDCTVRPLTGPSAMPLGEGR